MRNGVRQDFAGGDGVAVYHLKAGFGSRAGGQSAAAKSEYIERDGRYERDREELEHRESGNMPAWAQDDPHAYWQAADDHERANGRLYSEIQFALPRELDAGRRQALAGAFAERVCAGERLPYTLAIHRGGADGANPHAHLMFSERGNDGIARPAEQWFKRHNPKAPEQGGALKSRAAKAGDWLATTRQAWEQTANRALEQAGREARIDHRSLADRRDAAARAGDLDRAAELSREPNIHLGPERYRASRGGASATVARAARVLQTTATAQAERDAARRQVARVEREIAAVGARLKETYDRVRRALDARIQHAGRAIRAGAAAAQQAGRALGRAGAAISRSAELRPAGVYQVEQDLERASAAISRSARVRSEGVSRVERAHVETAGKLERTCRDIDQGIQRTRAAFGRGLKAVRDAVDHTRTRPAWLPDRVEARIESLIARTRDRGGPSR